MRRKSDVVHLRLCAQIVSDPLDGVIRNQLGDITTGIFQVAENQGLSYEIALLLLAKARVESTTGGDSNELTARASQMLEELGVKAHPELLAIA